MNLTKSLIQSDSAAKLAAMFLAPQIAAQSVKALIEIGTHNVHGMMLTCLFLTGFIYLARRVQQQHQYLRVVNALTE